MKRKTEKGRSHAVSHLTLEDLDGERWGEPTYDSYVVRTAHAIRRKPIGTLTDEELRLAIGQAIGLDWLVPLALERLEQNPFRSGDFYEGDLLANVVRVPDAYWAPHPGDRALLVQDIIVRTLHDGRFAYLTRDARQAVIALGTPTG